MRFRARGRGRSTLFATVIGVATGLAYVGLFTQAFSVMAHTVDLAGQVAVLALVTTTIGVRKPGGARGQQRGGPRRIARERIPARAAGVAGGRWCAARGLADAVVDPVGALFLLPVLISAGVVWRLGAPGWPLAIVISMLTQIAISMLAYAVQLAVVRYVPGRAAPDDVDGAAPGRGAVAGDALDAGHLGDADARRAGDPGARHRVASSLFSPGMLVSAPLAALARGDPVQAAGMLLALAIAVGRHDLAGRRGRAPRRDGGLGRGGRGLGGGDARAAADVPPADGGDQGSAADRARSLAAAGADRDAGDLHRRADLRRRGLGLDDGQPGADLVFRVFARAVHGHHRPAHAHAGRAARLLDPAHRAGAARAVCSPPRRAPGPSSSAAWRRWCSR